MKPKTLITIVLGVAIVVAAAAMSGCTTGGSTTPTPTPKAMKTTTDVLEKFDLLKNKVNASGNWFGGAATQLINGDETAMVYIYLPQGQTDNSDLVSAGYSALISVFDTQDPLLVGLIDTSQKVNDQQYKVDVYASERPLVELYADGSITKSELFKKALFVTAQTQDLRTSNETGPTVTPFPKPTKNYTPPADRQAYLTENLNRSGYKAISLQGGSMPDGGKAISLALEMPDGATNAQKYAEIETGLKVCAAAFGDYDKYYLNIISDKGNEYYVIDASSAPVIDYADGSIDQYQLYNAINLTYYTK